MVELFKSLWEISPLLALFGVAMGFIWKRMEKSDRETKTSLEKNATITRELMGETNRQQEQRINDLQKEFAQYKEEVTIRMKEKDETFSNVVESYRETIQEFKECNTRIAKIEEDITEIKILVKHK